MRSEFDAIIIGSGLGGLTGAVCAKAGLRVLVLERSERFGGAATVYRHNGLAIEVSLHEMDGFDDDDPKMPLIRLLGLDRSLQFADVGDLYEVRGAVIGDPFVLFAEIATSPSQLAGLVRATIDKRDKQHDRSSCQQNLYSLSRGHFSTNARASRGKWRFREARLDEYGKSYLIGAQERPRHLALGQPLVQVGFGRGVGCDPLARGSCLARGTAGESSNMSNGSLSR
jgi:choline dehydrogenase-like flavoprotein